MLTSVPGPTIFQSQWPKNVVMRTTAMVTRAVSEHIFTLPKSFLTHFAMASGRPSPASISESQRTSQAIPKASSAPPIRSSANCRGQPSVWSRVGGICRKLVSHIVRSV